MKNKLLLVDGSSLAFRAFFSILDLSRFKNQNGLHTNALYSFHRMFLTVLEAEKPTHVLVAWDAGKTTFRNELFTDYKAGRSKTPSEFSEQLPYFNVLLDALGIAHYRLPHYEADDIIGTMAHQAVQEQFDVVVLSGDKDLIQLASSNVTVKITTKGVSELVIYTPEVIHQKFGLSPQQIIDMKGLMGDSSDNYPGVTKVGEKTAVKLLQEYGSVEGIYEQIGEMKTSKLKENLIKDKQLAFLSKDLARINCASPVTMTIEDTKRKATNVSELLAFYKEMNFNSFQKELLANTTVTAESSRQHPEITFQVIDSIQKEQLEQATTVYFEYWHENYHTSSIVAVAFGNADTVFITSMEQACHSNVFKEWLAKEDVSKITFDSKALKVLAHREKMDVKGINVDISLMAYVLDPNQTIKEVADVAKAYEQPYVQFDDVIYGKGAKRQLPAADILYHHLATKVQALSLLADELATKLKDNQQDELYTQIELPLASVLADMEIQGIYVDQSRLKNIGEDLEERLKEIEALVYEEAGEIFNLNSPKQLAVILFEKMQLPVIKKTKTGYSTAVDVLEKLAPKAPIVRAILEYRQLAKLKSTYVEGLQAFIQKDQKIHTRYLQHLTQTGRLSSVDPNLQNIPIRTEEGRSIRHAFLPSHPNWQILSSDYSQIELRVLAHISKDEQMIQAFKNGMDIHTTTAMRVFGIDRPEAVTSDMRRQAKAVNFGIVYGISDYGLSQNLNISRARAKEFIERYLTEFSGVKHFMERIVEQAREVGYVETLFHRRRYLPDLYASNFNVRSFAERTAINSPIQGSAADILKLAMIELAREMQERSFKAKMLLQVHDELIFEVPNEEVAALQSLVEEVMENAVKLAVPLKVDSNVGDSWYEAK